MRQSTAPPTYSAPLNALTRSLVGFCHHLRFAEHPRRTVRAVDEDGPAEVGEVSVRNFYREVTVVMVCVGEAQSVAHSATSQK